ncbi:MAG: hypothetical protein H7099_02470 [Gemmatimonadaceae bacterium]|nr:hypothetical protein [Gemmatimonadaceae bacterium]
MPTPSSPGQKRHSVSNFSFKIGGLPAGQFTALSVASSPGRDTPAHELAHLMQQQRALPGKGPFQLTLLRGTCANSTLMTWKAAASGKPCELVYEGAGATAATRWKLENVKVVSYQTSSTAAGGGSDIAFEKIVIMHEGVKP